MAFPNQQKKTVKTAALAKAVRGGKKMPKDQVDADEAELTERSARKGGGYSTRHGMGS